jgi:hypothetical protein
MIEISVFKNTKYSKRITLPAQVLRALGNPDKLFLSLEDNKIILEVKQDEEIQKLG